LWRGAPFEGVDSTWLEKYEAPRLEERYLAAPERRIDIDIADGPTDVLVAELAQLTRRHPLRESLWVRLLVALHRSGRQAEALVRYEAVRARLADELGTDPGPELQRVYADLLAGREPQPTVSLWPVYSRHGPIPRQLPLDLASFAGRASDVKRLNALLPGSAQDMTKPVIVAIHGAPGVGKTTLAVHWSHDVAERFPDGQLYVNLRGYDLLEPAVEPGIALRGFLQALGVSQTRMPTDVPSQAAMYRSILASRHLLVVLDNASNAEQVRPLLPGTAGCVVVITSRNQLLGLVASDGVQSHVCDVLSIDESREMLSRRLGHDRLAAETHAVDDIIERCVRLPLALAIAAARAEANPSFSLADLAYQLEQSKEDLEAFSAGDAATDIRAVFSWSFHTLPDDAARLFRLLPIHPGPELVPSAVASLAAIPVEQVRPLLAELARAHMISETAPERYSIHDLLRAYALEQGRVVDPPGRRTAAMRRLFDHYLHTAGTAAALLVRSNQLYDQARVKPGVTLEPMSQREEAYRWFSGEYSSLLAVLVAASLGGFNDYVWTLATYMWEFLERQGRWQDLIRTESAALEAARRMTDKAGQATVHQALAIIHARLGRYTEAHGELDLALELTGELNDAHLRSTAHLCIAWLLEQQGRYGEALHESQTAYEVSRSAGSTVDEAEALSAIARCHAHLGELEQGIAECCRALVLQESGRAATGRAETLNCLGYAHHRLGRHQQAIGHYLDSLSLYRNEGHRYGEADTLSQLGDAYLAVGDHASAQASWRAAAAILSKLGDPGSAIVRRKLERA